MQNQLNLDNPSNSEDKQNLTYNFIKCYVNIYNYSKHTLLNASISANWGEYTTKPPTNIEKGTNNQPTIAKFTMQGKANIASGCEGSVEYSVDDLGLGTLNFYYTVPYSGSNQGKINNKSVGIKWSVYAVSKSGDYNWGTDKSKWGNEGQVPSGGNQLSLLFVIEDTHTT